MSLYSLPDQSESVYFNFYSWFFSKSKYYTEFFLKHNDMVTSFLLILIISRMMHAHHLYSPPPWSELDVLWLIYPWLETKWAEHIWAFLLLVRPRPPQLPLWTPSLRRTPYHPAMKSEFWDRIFDFVQISFRIFGHFFSGQSFII